MSNNYMWRTLALTLAMVSGAAFAQSDRQPWDEYDKKIKAAEEIAAFGPDLFGDTINLANGALSFSVTDVSIPGNSKLPVAFTRTLSIANRKGYQYNDSPLADWDIDAPKISGVFRNGGDSFGSICTATTPAQGRPPAAAVSGTTFLAADYWAGNTASMPGGGELLLANPATPKPSSGGPYYWMTSGFVYFSCLPSIKNGTGQGFLAVAPDGTKYWFDWLAQYREPDITQVVASASQNSSTGPWTVKATLSRARKVLYATRVEDRFGNWVTYTYGNSATGPALLTRIEANDGRLITVGYDAQGHVATVNAGARTWTYGYVYPTAEKGSLSSVILPDNSRWTLDLAALSSASIRYERGTANSGAVRSCGDPGGVITTGAQGSVTHPSGAVGVFQVDPTRHGRSNVPKMCAGYSAPYNNDNDDIAFYPLNYDSLSLIKKSVSGPGLATMEWNYQYQSSIYFAPGTGPTCPVGDCMQPICTSDSCAGTSVTHVWGPGSDYQRHTYGNSYRYNEGKLLKVETGTAVALSMAATILRSQSTGYQLAQSGQTYQTPIGTSPQERGSGFSGEYLRPQLTSTTLQDSVTYSSTTTAAQLDDFARPLAVTRASNIGSGYSRIDTTEYHDDKAKWVVGQEKRTTTGGVEVSETEFNANALPYRIFRYNDDANPVQTLTYNADGTLATFMDGNGKLTLLSNWKRGVPQSIQYPATPESPSGGTESASVNDNGWVAATTDENGYVTNYQYDAMGRLSRVIYPIGDTVPWNDKAFAFEQINEVEFGIPAGHWRQVTSQGNYQKVTVFDALWRPLWQYQRDLSNGDATFSLVGKSFDHEGREVFASYPRNPYADGNWTIDTGTRTSYDSLGRVTKAEQDSELGSRLTTTTEYLADGETRVTDPNGQQTRTRYAAWDQPTTEYPIEITHPEGALTQITRDYFFRPTQVRRSGTYAGQTVEAVRKYYYDGVHRLCRSDEPETGATVMGYDNADNLTWSASGLTTLNAVDCDHIAAYNGGRTVTRSYDGRNRLYQMAFPEGGLGNQTWTYTKDGLPASITTANGANNTWPTINRYEYNKRGMLLAERVEQPNWYNWRVGYEYDTNGHLRWQSYPTGLLLDYAPNALGQPTQVATTSTSTTQGTYASGVSYHPNGAIKQFTYGNGIVHSMWQNARQLPWTVSDGGISGFSYTYDKNGSPTQITDNAQGANFNRYLQYDGLNRLKAAGSAMFGGSTHYINYAYDPIDNIRGVSHPGVREHTYWYNANNHLTNVQNAGGATVTGLGYDVQGNLNNKNGQGYWFDYGNRLRSIPGVESYSYDGHGRRVQAAKPDGTMNLFMYTQGGQYLFGWKSTAAGTQTTQENVYLAGSVIATIDHNWPSNTVIATKYQHTDALGSPVAMTNTSGAVIERTNYEPYGSAINKVVDGIGYTGHVMDGATGLTYMQQRYYDSELGRFLSVDPVTANSSTGTNFNRYWYANNSPYKFVDPDGRASIPMILDAVRIEGSAGAQLQVNLRVGNTLAASVGLGSLSLGGGSSGNDMYSFEEAKGPSLGVEVLDKVQFGWTPTTGRTEQGRYDVPQTNSLEEGQFEFGLKGKAGDADAGATTTGSSTEISLKVGAILGIELKVDVGQLAHGLLSAKPGEKPGQEVEAKAQWGRALNSGRVK